MIQLSSSLRPTAFDFVTCDSFQVRSVKHLSIPLCAKAFRFATSNSFRFHYLRQLQSSSLRTTVFDFVTCKSFIVRHVQQLSIPLCAKSFKFATSNTFRFRYVRQLSSSLRPTAFDYVMCDSFQVRYVQQLSIPLRATAVKFVTSNSFRFQYVRQL